MHEPHNNALVRTTPMTIDGNIVIQRKYYLVIHGAKEYHLRTKPRNH